MDEEVEEHHADDGQRHAEIPERAPDGATEVLAVPEDAEEVRDEEGAEHEDGGEQRRVGLRLGSDSIEKIGLEIQLELSRLNFDSVTFLNFFKLCLGVVNLERKLIMTFWY